MKGWEIAKIGYNLEPARVSFLGYTVLEVLVLIILQVFTQCLNLLYLVKYQKDFDAEVKASIGEALSNSVVIRGNYEFYRKIFFDNYNIILPQPTGQ